MEARRSLAADPRELTIADGRSRFLSAGQDCDEGYHLIHCVCPLGRRTA